MVTTIIELYNQQFWITLACLVHKIKYLLDTVQAFLRILDYFLKNEPNGILLVERWLFQDIVRTTDYGHPMKA